MGDWSMLPYELLGEIALKLDCLEDVVYFSIVCTSWQCAYTMIKNKWIAKVPWLLLPENAKDNPKCLRKLFSPNIQRCYKLELPETFGARCWGTSSGWVVTFDSLELYVFNPFSGVRILLPPQFTIPFKREYKKNVIDWLRQNYIDKTYVFDLYKDDFVVVVLHGGLMDCKIAYARPCDEAWTPVTTLKRCVHDVLHLDTQLLVVFNDGMVGYCNIPTFQKSQPPTVVKEYLPTPPLGDLSRVPFRRFYLLEYFGCLLFVYRYKKLIGSKSVPRTWDKNVCYCTKGFDVYLFNFDTKNWKIIEDLGDVALFLGNNCSMAVDISATNNIKRNCIYFTDDETLLWSVPILYGGHDMGIYDLKKKKVKPIYKGDDIHSAFCTAIWFWPKLFC